MLSAYCDCCIYSNALQSQFNTEENTMNPVQTTPKEQSDMGPYCLQYRSPKYIIILKDFRNAPPAKILIFLSKIYILIM